MIHKPPTHRPALAVKTGLKAGACEPPYCSQCESDASWQNCIDANPCSPPVCDCPSEDDFYYCLGGG